METVQLFCFHFIPTVQKRLGSLNGNIENKYFLNELLKTIKNKFLQIYFSFPCHLCFDQKFILNHVYGIIRYPLLISKKCQCLNSNNYNIY